MYYTLMEEFKRYTSEGEVIENRVVGIYFHFNEAIANMVLCEFRDVHDVGKTISYYITESSADERSVFI